MWEYKVEQFLAPSLIVSQSYHTSEKTLHYLEEMGKESWELVEVVVFRQGASIVYYWKRPKKTS